MTAPRNPYPHDRTPGGQPRHGYTGGLDAPEPPKPPRRWRRTLLIGLGLLALVIVLAAMCSAPAVNDAAAPAPAPTAESAPAPAPEPPTAPQPETAPAPAPEPAPEPPVEPEPATFGDGTYLVGTDIEPGTYRSAGAAPGPVMFCAWFTREGASSNSTVIDVGTASEERSPMVVEIGEDVGAFESSGCAPWERVP